LDAMGITRNHGTDFTLYFSKTITSLPRPVIVNAGVRMSDAVHIGLLGFTNKYRALFEGNVIVLATDHLGLSAEYRMKPNDYDPIPGLIEREDDWWTLCACYVVNNHLTISGGYAHFGQVLNHQANGSWGIKSKWEF